MHDTIGVADFFAQGWTSFKSLEKWNNCGSLSDDCRLDVMAAVNESIKITTSISWS